MTWRIGIRHVTGYEYERPVTSSYNEARITPISNDRQLVMESEVEVSPSAAVYRYWDWWGTLVHSFDLHEPHDELVADLPSHLASLQECCSAAGDALARRFFRQSAPQEWSLEIAAGRQ